MYGEIYLIENKENGKCYIGQALKYVSNNKNKWGTNGRWKSHIREACSKEKDHCSLLNSAIRKYTPTGFNISTLCECENQEELNEKEIYYIAEYNSLAPNGYNLKAGGSFGKAHLLSIEKQKKSRMGLKHTDITKQNISKGQLGNRRGIKKRKYPEDNELPKYIKANRINNKITGYEIGSFPIGIETKEYLPTIRFSIAKYNTKEEALNSAVDKLNELKKEYSYVEENIQTIKDEHVITQLKKTQKELIIESLPEYVFPIFNDNNQLEGYSVDGLADVLDVNVQKVVFTDFTNKYNLEHAGKFIEKMKYINDNFIDISNVPLTDLIDCSSPCTKLKGVGNEYIPMYMNIVNQKGVAVGYCINNYPIHKKDTNEIQKFYKKYTKSLLTMEEKYILAYDKLKQLRESFPIPKKNKLSSSS